MSSNPVVPSSDNGGVDPSNVGSLPVPPQSTQSLDTSPAPTSTPAHPGMWKDILQGALWGMSGVSQTKGRGSFGVGLAQGVQGATEGQQREQQQQIQQQQIKFQSAQAAASLAEASKRSQLADIQIAEGKLNLAELADNVHAYNQALGIPDADVTISGQQPNDMHTQAAGALQTLSSQNGGTVPRVVTVDEPAHDANGNTHTVSVFASPSTDDLTKAGGAYLKLVNDSRAVQGEPALSDQDWRTGVGTVPNTGAQNGMALLNAQRKWQGQQVMDAQKNLYQAPMPSAKPDENAATSAHLQQQLDSYSARPDANPAVVSLLKSQQAAFDTASETQRQLASKAQQQTTLENAPVEASTAAAKKTAETNAEASTPTGQLASAEKQTQIAKGQTDIEKFNEDNVVAFDPNYANTDGSKGGNVVVTRQQAKDQGLTNFYAKGVDPSLINGIVAGFNDVQNKLNQLASVANDPKTMSQVNGPVAAQMLKDGAGIKIGAFGFELNTEATSVNTADYQTQLANANPATRAYVTATIAAHEAVTQLPRLQTFGKSSRMSQQQMEAAVKMLPAPADDPDMAARKMTSLQTTIDPLRKQVPHMPGAELTPSWLEQNNSQALKQAAPGIQNAIHGVYNPQTRSIDPFAGINTRALLNGGQ